MLDYITILRRAISAKLFELKLTQNELAGMLGVSQSQLSKVISGKTSSAQHLELIATKLQISMADLGRARDHFGEIEEPPVPGGKWQNHLAAQEAMRSAIEDECKKSEEVNIQTIGVALRFTWDFLKIELPQIICRHAFAGGSERRINLSLGMVSQSVLAAKSKHLGAWKASAELTEKEIMEYIKKTKEEAVESAAKREKPGVQIGVSLFSYEFLPQWHGILINSSSLFLGRTRWSRQVGGSWVFSVGQEPYRLFTTESGEGVERIRMFLGWFEYLYSTGIEIGTNILLEAPPRPSEITEIES